jgi:beta-mannosidase
MEIPVSGMFDHFLDTTHAYRFGPPAFDLAVGTMVDMQTGATVDECFYLPGPPSLSMSSDIGLEAWAASAGDTTWELTLGTKKFARSIAIEIPDFVPEDAYFHLAPQAERRVRLHARRPGVKPQGVVRPLNAHVPTKVALRATSSPASA